MSKMLNHKVKVNKFVALPGESVSISLDRFIAFMRGLPNNRIYIYSLKEYLYQGQGYNNKSILDTIAGGRGSYRKCTYAEIIEKLKKLSRNSKAWR